MLGNKHVLGMTMCLEWVPELVLEMNVVGTNMCGNWRVGNKCVVGISPVFLCYTLLH